MKIVFYISIILFSSFSFSQVNFVDSSKSPFFTSCFQVRIVPTTSFQRTIPDEYVRFADLVWSKMVLRSLSFEDSINFPIFQYSQDENVMGSQKYEDRLSLWHILRKHILNGDLTLFSPYDPSSYGLGRWDGDEFIYPVYPVITDGDSAICVDRDLLVYYLAKVNHSAPIPLLDENREPIIVEGKNGEKMIQYEPIDTLWYTKNDIVEYYIKEYWYFDKERSQLNVQILGIAPVIASEEGDENTNRQAKRELFWLYFPQCREVLKNYRIHFNCNNEQFVGLDDWFIKRFFKGNINETRMDEDIQWLNDINAKKTIIHP